MLEPVNQNPKGAIATTCTALHCHAVLLNDLEIGIKDYVSGVKFQFCFCVQNSSHLIMKVLVSYGYFTFSIIMGSFKRHEKLGKLIF